MNNHMNTQKTNHDFFRKLPLIIICTLLTSTSQILFKFSSIPESINWIRMSYFIAGLILYAGSAILMIFILKISELSSLYPFFSISYIWVTLASFFIFGEQISIMATIGLSFIIIGVILVGRGAS